MAELGRFEVLAFRIVNIRVRVEEPQEKEFTSNKNVAMFYIVKQWSRSWFLYFLVCFCGWSAAMRLHLRRLANGIPRGGRRRIRTWSAQCSVANTSSLTLNDVDASLLLGAHVM